MTGAVSAALALRSALEHEDEDLVKGFMLLTEEQRAALAGALAAAVFGAERQWPGGRSGRAAD